MREFSPAEELANFSKDTPPEFRFATNVLDMEREDVFAEFVGRFGAANVVVTDRAYDCNGVEWPGGCAIHLRVEAGG